MHTLKASPLCCDPPFFRSPVRTCDTGPLWSIVRQLMWVAAHCSRVALCWQRGQTIRRGLVWKVERTGTSSLNWMAGTVAARGPWCGQPFSACHYWWYKDISKRVKWDRMVVNAGAQAWNMIRPPSWIEVLLCQKPERERQRGRWRQKETEWHCFHILSPTHLTMQALCPSHYKWSLVRCIVGMYEWLFMSHMLCRQKEKRKDLCVPKANIRKLSARPALCLHQHSFTVSWTHRPPSRDSCYYHSLYASAPATAELLSWPYVQTALSVSWATYFSHVSAELLQVGHRHSWGLTDELIWASNFKSVMMS